ncbi:MAG: hypothetical protein ACP5EP_12150 [Acidobacteriaceae bacterium]
MDTPMDTISQQEYVRELLLIYVKTPGTTGKVRRQDRLQAAILYQQKVPLTVAQNALLLAAARRLLRPEGAPPLATVRSLAYFLPVIDEVLHLDVNPAYFHYLQNKIERYAPAPLSAPTKR